MIRFIAAIDNKRGIADDHGIPWDLPTDVSYYRGKVRFHAYLIGYGTYIHYTKPLEDTQTYVATTQAKKLRTGFSKVSDAREFLQNTKEDVWVGGGAGVFESTIDLADELYLTRVNGDFNCTKFFPEFEQDFSIIESGKPHIENDITFHFEVWKRK
jgi:dihydrofolate reductase